MIKTLAIGLILSIAGLNSASAAFWTVQRSSGEVTVSASRVEGVTSISVKTATELPNGAVIRTGKTGRVLLIRDRETMTIGPGALVTIPGDNIFGFTTVVQQLGEVAFDVEKRNVWHFEVRTPYLAAVVKGTHFVVRIHRTGADVSVSRGRVGVTDAATGRSTDILPGQTAATSSGRPGLMISGQINAAVVAADQQLASLPANSEKGKDKGKSDAANSGSSSNGGNDGGGKGGKTKSDSEGGSGNSGNGNAGGSGNSGNNGGGKKGKD